MHSTSFHGSVTRKSFSKILVWIHEFVLYTLVSVESPVEKNSRWLPTSSRKKEDQTRSGVSKAKLATCGHLSLLGFLRSVVISQNTDSNVEIKICENKTDGQEAVKTTLICTLSEKSSNQRSNVFSHKGTGKIQARETIDLQLVESLKKCK